MKATRAWSKVFQVQSDHRFKHKMFYPKNYTSQLEEKQKFSIPQIERWLKAIQRTERKMTRLNELRGEQNEVKSTEARNKSKKQMGNKTRVTNVHLSIITLITVVLVSSS